MADQVEEWKGYGFSFGTYEMIYSFIFSGQMFFIFIYAHSTRIH